LAHSIPIEDSARDDPDGCAADGPVTGTVVLL